jgi:hypothetical protein
VEFLRRARISGTDKGPKNKLQSGTMRGRITENAGPGGLSNSRCFCAPLFGPAPYHSNFPTKREVKSLNAGVQEFDLESPVFYLLAICSGKAQPSEGSLVASEGSLVATDATRTGIRRVGPARSGS